MKQFLHALFHPDEADAENAERAEVARAANILQVGEFQLLQLAYRSWHSTDLPEALVAQLFTSYMLQNEVPHWARHYARDILARDERGELDDMAGYYHRYDYDYHTWVPRGVQRFCVAAACVCVAVFGSIYVANQVVDSPTSLLPPYFEEKDLRRVLPDMSVGDRDHETFISPGGAGNFSDVSGRAR